jgi:uncharacterized membrane protein
MPLLPTQGHHVEHESASCSRKEGEALMPSVFLLLIGLAFLFAILSLIPATNNYPVLGLSVLLLCVALLVTNR